MQHVLGLVETSPTFRSAKTATTRPAQRSNERSSATKLREVVSCAQDGKLLFWDVDYPDPTGWFAESQGQWSEEVCRPVKRILHSVEMDRLH